MRPKILMGSFNFFYKNEKINGTSPKPCSFIYDFFPKSQTHNMLALMLDPCCYPKPSVMELEIETSLT